MPLIYLLYLFYKFIFWHSAFFEIFSENSINYKSRKKRGKICSHQFFLQWWRWGWKWQWQYKSSGWWRNIGSSQQWKKDVWYFTKNSNYKLRQKKGRYIDRREEKKAHSSFVCVFCKIVVGNFLEQSWSLDDDWWSMNDKLSITRDPWWFRSTPTRVGVSVCVSSWIIMAVDQDDTSPLPKHGSFTHRERFSGPQRAGLFVPLERAPSRGHDRFHIESHVLFVYHTGCTKNPRPLSIPHWHSKGPSFLTRPIWTHVCVFYPFSWAFPLFS